MLGRLRVVSSRVRVVVFGRVRVVSSRVRMIVGRVRVVGSRVRYYPFAWAGCCFCQGFG